MCHLQSHVMKNYWKLVQIVIGIVQEFKDIVHEGKYMEVWMKVQYSYRKWN